MSTGEKPVLAIIGGGQLGMFLCDAAKAQGIRTLIISPDPSGPAVDKADLVIIAEFDSDNLASRISRDANFVTYELEDVPEKLLGELAAEQQKGAIQVRPGTHTLSLLKNKATQKRWLLDNNIPTLSFMTLDSPHSSEQQILEFGFPLVQKAQTGGYDGYGVQIIHNESEKTAIWNVPSIFEPYIPNPEELAVVVARSSSGAMVTYEPVRMDFSEQNTLDAVVFPTGLNETLNTEAICLARDVVERLQGVGVFAVEMFLLPDKQILVNEISPRVHNSGHHTMETSEFSQFDLHVRAVCDLPLPNPGLATAAAIMRNLLYYDELEFLLKYPSTTMSSEEKDIFLHWYGKTEGREGRKMGHITCLSSKPEESEKRMKEFIEQLRQQTSGAAA